MLMPTENPEKRTPTLNVVCRGSAQDMGEAQGEMLRERVSELYRALAQMEPYRLKQPKWMPYGLYRRLTEQKSGKYLASALKDSPEIAARLQGLARGANLSIRAASLFHALEPMLSAVDPESAHAASAGCSVVAVGKNRSARKEPIIGRNFDYLPLAQPFYILRRDEPKYGLRSLIFTSAPLIGAVDGINEAGLCITFNYAYTVDSARPAPTISMRIAEILSQCRTVEEAAAWMKKHPHWGAGLLLLVDESGDMASLELSQSRSHLRRSQNDEDIVFHSNRFHCAEMSPVQVSESAHWSQRAPRALRGTRILQSSETRDARFQELLSSEKTWDLGDLSHLFSDHGPNNTPSRDTICIHSDYWQTTASLQLLPASRKLRISYSTACQADYQEFQLD